MKRFKKVAKWLFYLFVGVIFLVEGSLLARNLYANPNFHDTSPKPSPLNKYIIFEKINGYRLSKNLNALKWNPAMCEFAHVRLEQIHSDWSHNGWLNVKDYYKYVYFGENLIKGYDTDQGAIDAWIASPEHLENIVKPQYTDTCIDTDMSRDNTNSETNFFAIQHFASF